MTFPACYQAFGRNFYIEPASVQFANAVFQDEYNIRELRQHDVKTIVDVGAHVGSFAVLCHHYWPTAKIIAVEPHPESFELLQRNTHHIPASQLLLINAAVTKQPGATLLASPVSHSRVSEYVPAVWQDLEPRNSHFGIEVPAITTEQLWSRIAEFLGREQTTQQSPHVDLLKLDCEGAEYLILPELSRLQHLSSIGWLRGEWHSRQHNHLLTHSLAATHQFHIDPNELHDVGLFVGHRKA